MRALRLRISLGTLREPHALLVVAAELEIARSKCSADRRLLKTISIQEISLARLSRQ